jgi:5'-3' exonuclease
MKLHLIDGTYELFRAYYGSPKRTGLSGKEIGAVHGLTRSLLALIRDERVTHIAAGFDHVIESFRNEMFDGYKTRAGVEPDLLAQFDLAEQLAVALGITTWPMIQFETDDALATAAFRWSSHRQIQQIRICSPDKDFSQCVTGDRVVCLNRRTDVVMSEEGVKAKFGVTPSSIPDWLGLVGDSADGIPGLRGWGQKTASRVLSRYPRLEAIPQDPENWEVSVRGQSKLALTLQENFEQALLYRELATLRTDVPLQESLADLVWKGCHRKELKNLSEEFRDTTLLDRVTTWRPDREGP